jgi:phosphohistidine phosphatase SixA
MLQAENPKLVLPQVLLEDRLYLASDSTILSIANDESKRHDACRCIMVLGHNPGMELLASKLSGKPVSMPTGAIAVLASDAHEGEWPTDWGNDKMWKWRGLVKPRELGSETI